MRRFLWMYLVVSDIRAPEVGSLIDQPRAIFTLEFVRGDATLVRMRMTMSARSNALLGFGGGRTGGREGRAIGRLVVGGSLAPSGKRLPGYGGTPRRHRRESDSSSPSDLESLRRGDKGGSGASVCRIRGYLRATTVIEARCIGRHSRGVGWCGGRVGNRKGLDGGDGTVARSWCRWRNFVDCHRLRRITSSGSILGQLGAGCLIFMVKATQWGTKLQSVTDSGGDKEKVAYRSSG